MEEFKRMCNNIQWANIQPRHVSMLHHLAQKNEPVLVYVSGGFMIEIRPGTFDAAVNSYRLSEEDLFAILGGARDGAWSKLAGKTHHHWFWFASDDKTFMFPSFAQVPEKPTKFDPTWMVAMRLARGLISINGMGDMIRHADGSNYPFPSELADAVRATKFIRNIGHPFYSWGPSLVQYFGAVVKQRPELVIEVPMALVGSSDNLAGVGALAADKTVVGVLGGGDRIAINQEVKAQDYVKPDLKPVRKVKTPEPAPKPAKPKREAAVWEERDPNAKQDMEADAPTSMPAPVKRPVPTPAPPPQEAPEEVVNGKEEIPGTYEPYVPKASPPPQTEPVVHTCRNLLETYMELSESDSFESMTTTSTIEELIEKFVTEHLPGLPPKGMTDEELDAAIDDFLLAEMPDEAPRTETPLVPEPAKAAETPAEAAQTVTFSIVQGGKENIPKDAVMAYGPSCGAYKLLEIRNDTAWVDAQAQVMQGKIVRETMPEFAPAVLKPSLTAPIKDIVTPPPNPPHQLADFMLGLFGKRWLPHTYLDPGKRFVGGRFMSDFPDSQLQKVGLPQAKVPLTVWQKLGLTAKRVRCKTVEVPWVPDKLVDSWMMPVQNVDGRPQQLRVGPVTMPACYAYCYYTIFGVKPCCAPAHGTQMSGVVCNGKCKRKVMYRKAACVSVSALYEILSVNAELTLDPLTAYERMERKFNTLTHVGLNLNEMMVFNSEGEIVHPRADTLFVAFCIWCAKSQGNQLFPRAREEGRPTGPDESSFAMVYHH